jgi:anti-sigma regulatory factor (Ser/Thr protein kinase)
MLRSEILTPTERGDLELLVSELVTNAVVHSGSADVCLSVRIGNPLRVCVRDHGEGYPQLKIGAAAGGFGLQAVRTLASLWGVERLDEGKVVWFDLPLSTWPT